MFFAFLRGTPGLFGRTQVRQDAAGNRRGATWPVVVLTIDAHRAAPWNSWESGQACIRGLRITVRDVLEYLAAGETAAQIVDEFPDLTLQDIQACLAYAADRERRLWTVPAA